VLTFDFGGLSLDPVPANYGNHVGNPGFPTPPGWSYGGAGGPTDHVGVNYDPLLLLGASNPPDPARVFGDLNNVLYRSRNGGFEPGILQITFSADPGWLVCLDGFSIAAVYNSLTTFGEDLPARSISVLDGIGTTLFRLDFDNGATPNHASLATTWAPGTGPGQGDILRHKRYLFGPPLQAPTLTLRLDFTQLITIGGGKQDRIGIDDIEITQIPIPAPATAPAILCISLAACRRRR